MQKRYIVLMILFIIIAVLALLLLTSLPFKETAGLPEPEKEPPVLEIPDLLKQLKAAESGFLGLTAEETLREMAERNDAIGYAANTILAETDTIPAAEKIRFSRQALELYESKDLRYRLAALLETLNKTDAAIQEYLMLLPDKQALEALINVNADTALILDQLASGGHWRTAHDVIELLPEESANDAIQLSYGQILVELGQYAEALEVLTELAQRIPENPQMQYHYARALEAAGKTQKAILAYESSGTYGAYRLGRLYEKLGRSDEAAEAYAVSTDAAALWRGAFLWDESGNSRRALATYRRLMDTPGQYQDDAAYRAFILQQDNDKDAEKALSLLKAPAWRKRLGRELTWAAAPDPKEVSSPVLDRLGAYETARRNDLIDIELAIAWRTASPEEKINIGEWFLQKNDRQQAVRWGSSALADLPAERAYLLAYPRPFEEEVLQAASEFSLEPELIWAVIREESRYLPFALSRVGAAGLMQLMPATAKEIASSLRTDFSENDLLDPAVNIRFGSFYLRKLLDMFHEDYDKALAAYNGGMGNVQRWSRSNLGKTENCFPTAITFYETREYITKVSNAYLTYKWLYRN